MWDFNKCSGESKAVTVPSLPGVAEMPLPTLRNLGDQTTVPHRGGAAVGSAPTQGPTQPAVTRQLLGRAGGKAAQPGWPQHPRCVCSSLGHVPLPTVGFTAQNHIQEGNSAAQLPAHAPHEEGGSLLHRNTSREF